MRRHLSPERNTINRVFGCYVNEARKIIATFDEPVALMGEDEHEQYLSILKKLLSGRLNQNLIDIEFTTTQVAGGEKQHALLMKLREERLLDANRRQMLYDTIIPTVNLRNNYLILMAYGAYDVPFRAASGDSSDEVFKYILCGICPVKQSKPGLEYQHQDKTFHMEDGDWVVAAPQLGFLFPAFDDRRANIYSALFYTKDIKDTHDAFVEAVFHAQSPKSATEQKAGFDQILEESLEDECTLEIVRAIHETVSDAILNSEDTKDPNPARIGLGSLLDVLDVYEISEPHKAKFKVAFDSTFGTGSEIAADNLIDRKHLEVKMPFADIQIDSDYSDAVQMKTINGVPYLAIRADGDVTVNGVTIKPTTQEK